MDSICQEMHEWVNHLPRFSNINNKEDIPDNGIYFFFEKGEKAHDLDRIVRIGSHTGQNNLKSRLFEHITKPNKDRSIFRKHIGRCLLANDPFLDYWNIDLTTKKNKEKFYLPCNAEKQISIENDVTNYIINNFNFTVVKLEDKENRLFFEKKLLATAFNCPSCLPSSGWLGLKHCTPTIHGGLWNIQGLNGQILSQEELFSLKIIA
jgi:hypothetical protein